ncbi:CAMK family protein kinase [Reticulomyxa filosa]|uniref:CAMK family protein kinase n=1 Tax=Reticulomyxa filosa TaxID=46433 RepID=X6MVZ1_RETFI|nr:CAMK family protein kinase [Reticulomyxa filosa]|eukprot:ETO17989.1 CAMK family protein kinase [Reticulomyxa filosa]
MARLKYRQQPLWKNYIIKRCRKRWNNVALVTVLDRRTRIQQMDMTMIPRTASAHGDDIISVQRSFHYMCHVLNKLQFNSVIKKLNHGADKFAYSCITESPTVRSFPDMLLEAKNRSIGYSERFVSQVIGSLMETVIFCHKHNCVNLNLNIGMYLTSNLCFKSMYTLLITHLCVYIYICVCVCVESDDLAFDSELRPILMDFSRALIIEPNDKVPQINYHIRTCLSWFLGCVTVWIASMMSSTPPELAMLMGTDSSEGSIELNGKTLRKADSWRVGVLLYALMTGMLPYTASTLQNFITQILMQKPAVPLDEIKCSQHLKRLLAQLLEPAYFKRIDIQDAIKDPWFSVMLC